MPDWGNDSIAGEAGIDTLIGGYGLPAIRMRAYYFTEGFRVPAQRMLRDRDDLKAFLTEPESYPFFSMPPSAMLSFLPLGRCSWASLAF